MSVSDHPLPPHEPHHMALRTATVYALFGILWILFSDQFLAVFTSELSQWKSGQTIKGCFYILITAVLIYCFAKHGLEATKRFHEKLARSEKNYRTIVETALEAICVTDERGHLTFVNSRMAEMVGCPAEQLIGRPLAEFIDPLKDSRIADQLASSPAHTARRYDLKLRRPDGRAISAIASVCPIHDEQHRYVGLLSMLTDITDRKQLEESLQQAQKLEAVGLLAGGIAHDFNNLLTAICGYAELAGVSLPEHDPVRKSLEGILAAASQAAGVTRALLTFSRRLPIHKQPVDFNEIVKKASLLLRRLIPASVEFVTDFYEGTAITVYADATQIQQVIMNLAINARDAMPDGGTLHISTHISAATDEDQASTGLPPGTPLVCLTVNDTGIGMSSDTRMRIFEPFFTTKPKGLGTGLGLSIIDSIVKDHGGRIRVQSEPGKGTVFTVLLPALTGTSLPTEAAATLATRGRGELILLADDNPPVREITTLALTAHGFQVLTAADGDEFMKLALQHRDRLQLIVTDDQMPKSDGRTCLRRLREQAIDIPAILVTGSLDANIEPKLPPHTVLVRKPFLISELLAVVVEQLGSKESANR